MAGKKATSKTVKKVRETTGAALTRDELKKIKKEILNEVLRETTGAALTRDELKTVKKKMGMNKGGTVKKMKNKKNSGLYGRR